jgi:GNAT superfamily N-acetyltransferase
MSSASIPLLKGETWTARPLSREDLPAIEDLLDAGRDFLELVSGTVDIAAEAESFLSELPPGKTISDKLSLGIEREPGRLVGVLDLIQGYPARDIWWIGLLLMRPDQRGQGLGEQVLNGVERYAEIHTAQELRLGVVETNPDGLRFWQRMGFTEIDRRPPTRFGEREQIILVMRKGLST